MFAVMISYYFMVDFADFKLLDVYRIFMTGFVAGFDVKLYVISTTAQEYPWIISGTSQNLGVATDPWVVDHFIVFPETMDFLGSSGENLKSEVWLSNLLNTYKNTYKSQVSSYEEWENVQSTIFDLWSESFQLLENSSDPPIVFGRIVLNVWQRPTSGNLRVPSLPKMLRRRPRRGNFRVENGGSP